MNKILNFLTVDLEEWFVVEIFMNRFTRDEWNKLPSTVVKNTRRLLRLFRHYDAKATWFVLGWVARQYPDLLQEIINDGHEVACHSFYHQRVDKMNPEEFKKDTETTIDAVVKAIGNQPFGYRAPSWSINSNIPWAFKILADLGFEYDSSIFPIKHDIYGMPEGPRQLFKMSFDDGGYLWELPASTLRIFGKNLPLGGGGFFRHSPYWYTKRMINKLNQQGQSVVVYIHPWEFDPDPPKIEGLSLMKRFRTYSSTSTLLYKFDKLLKDFKFTTISDYIFSQKKRRIGFN